MRAFTPASLRAFWNARGIKDGGETLKFLTSKEIIGSAGPQLLGVYLTCASGYADLPPGTSSASDGLFRAILNCRIVLRTLRSLATFIGVGSPELLSDVSLKYDESARDLKSIPLASSPADLAAWAEQRERTVYANLDAAVGIAGTLPEDVRLEGVLWLQGVHFFSGGAELAQKRVLMIDDMHKLRKRQHSMLLEEASDLRPAFPVWFAERSIALGSELLAQGMRAGRDISLDQLWDGPAGPRQFTAFAQNILDRRLDGRTEIPGPFSQYLRSSIEPADLANLEKSANDLFDKFATEYSKKTLYKDWIQPVGQVAVTSSFNALSDFFATRILVTRDDARRQFALDLAPLSAEEFADRDSPSVRGAAEIFMNFELGIPYYFGFERLAALSSFNVEELLTLASGLYEALRARQILRRSRLELSASEQEKLLREAAKKKRESIPRSHTEGTRAQRLIDSIGAYCRERTFLPNAPYAPGVTGVRLSQSELSRLDTGRTRGLELFSVARGVLAECVAENLLIARQSAASTSRDSGTVFYLNRTLALHYGLPLSFGGWQDVTAERLIEWMEKTAPPATRSRLALSP